MNEVPKLTSDVLISLSGVILSLVMFYIPPVRRWMDGQVGEWKFLFMAGVLLVVAALYTVLYCMAAWVCIQAEVGAMLWIWVGALLTNQGTYKALIEPAKKAEAKREELARLKWGG